MSERLSKEEVLGKIVKDGFQMDYDRMDNLVGVFKEDEVVENILLKVDEWNRHEAIGFAQWISDNGWQRYDDPERWICPHESKEVVSTEKLFDLYIKSKQQ